MKIKKLPKHLSVAEVFLRILTKYSVLLKVVRKNSLLRSVEDGFFDGKLCVPCTLKNKTLISNWF